ncbi:hypothetical protein DFH06DRAFT_151960 [Mycena polygramma]|nr:hypothetical protein DFH06DRAFT_151960 [Mycena polygramma]
MATETPPTSSERIARAADRARIADLDARIMDLEASLVALKEEKKLVQDRLTAYTYPVLTLPNEITSEVFTHLLPVYPKRPEPIDILSLFLVCRICRQWREIALATPTLWRAVSLTLWDREYIEPAILLLELLLLRSGSCPLSMKLTGSSPRVDSGMRRIYPMIAEHCARWEHMRIDNRLALFPAGELSLPCLRTLKLQWAEENSTATPIFLAAPLLKKVAIQDYLHNTHGSIFPWSQITVLSVQRISLEECADLLPQLLNLVCCRLDFNPATHRPSWSTSVTLAHLETLIMGDPFDLESRSTEEYILATLTVPALRRLHLSGLIDSTDSLTELVSRSRCSLGELCIPGTSIVPRHMWHTVLPSTTVFFSPKERLTIEDLFLEKLDNEYLYDTFSSEAQDSE